MATKKCEGCGEEFEGKATQKYCKELCRDLAAVERKHNLVYSTSGLVCNGHCYKEATKNIRKTAAGWKFIKHSSYAVKMGVLIDYCPFCGGRLT